jgi:hypothetical protein
MVGIDIATVLKKLNDTYDEQTQEEKYFGIKFIDRNGIVHEVECRKNVVAPRIKYAGSNARGKSEVNLKRNGIVMLYDRNAGHPITPKAAMIFQFQDFKSSKWLNVFH